MGEPKLQNIRERINNFKNCVVVAIQLFVLVCFYCRTTSVLGYVVHDSMGMNSTKV